MTKEKSINKGHEKKAPLKTMKERKAEKRKAKNEKKYD